MPSGVVRKVYVIVLANTATTANTLTIRIYRGASLEASVDFVIPPQTTIAISNTSTPVLVVPSGRTLKAIATAPSVSLLMTCTDV